MLDTSAAAAHGAQEATAGTPATPHADSGRPVPTTRRALRTGAIPTVGRGQPAGPRDRADRAPGPRPDRRGHRTWRRAGSAVCGDIGTGGGCEHRLHRRPCDRGDAQARLAARPSRGGTRGPGARRRGAHRPERSRRGDRRVRRPHAGARRTRHHDDPVACRAGARLMGSRTAAGHGSGGAGPTTVARPAWLPISAHDTPAGAPGAPAAPPAAQPDADPSPDEAELPGGSRADAWRRAWGLPSTDDPEATDEGEDR